MALGPVPPVLQLPWGIVGAGGMVTLTPQALEFLQLLSTGGAGGPVAWVDITGIPANVSSLAALVGGSDKLPYFVLGGTFGLTDLSANGRLIIEQPDMASVLDLLSPLTTKGDLFGFAADNVRVPVGTNGYVLTADSGAAAGVSWQPGGGGGGSAPPYHPLTFYGAVENGVTDDKPAIDAWLADATQHTVWLENVSATTSSTGRDFTKRARGAGQFHLTTTGDWIPAQFVWMTVKPATGVLPVGSSNYNFSGDISRTDARYTILGRLTPTGNIRRSLSEQYYEPVVTPRWEQLNNLSGYSGATCHLTFIVLAGDTTATVNSTAGITTGDTIGFILNGTVTETRVVTVTGPNDLAWAGGLANNYPAKSVLTLGLRTMDPISYMEVNHFGGGDAYAIVAVVGNGYQRTAGQQHWVETATVGLFGGSLAFSADVVYGTGLEMQYLDNGHNVTVIADVESFTRTNQTLANGTFWAHDWSQSTGIDATSGLVCPIDVFYTMGGWARVAFDTTRLTLTGQTADPAVQPAFQTALGHRWYMNGSVTAGGRATDPNGMYAAMYGNTPGDIYIGSGNDGSSDFLELKIDRLGGSRMRMRPDSINFNNPVNFGSQIHVAGNLIMPSGGYLHNIGVALYWFDGTTDHLIA